MKNGGRAFPARFLNDHGMPMDGINGMSMRDYFAAAAISQMLPWSYDAINDDRNKVTGYVGNIAKTAYDLADAMLAEREKSK